MIRFLVIDDEDQELFRLKEYLESKFTDLYCKLIHLPRGNGRSARGTTSAEQQALVVRELETNWPNIDCVLLDMALMGVPIEDNLISRTAVTEFFEKHPQYLKELENGTKNIIVISGLYSAKHEINLPTNLCEYIPIVHKPHKHDKYKPVTKRACLSKCFCDQYVNQDEMCERNNCLEKIIKSRVKEGII